MSEYDVRVVDAAEARDLRDSILRHVRDLRPDDVDETPSTLHVGGFRGEHLVGVGSVGRRAFPDETGGDAWQVHGFAIEHGHRGWGLGGLLLDRCLEHAAVHRARLAWADVPAGVHGFFERHGFHRAGDPFTVRSTPHYRMIVRFRRPGDD
ncbi:MAG: GNAT family N-acetyltransferase [Acidimicrobiia bacterium]|nr:GNAT family N-acetyltransferase [Acidimicrobiia bacterium]